MARDDLFGVEVATGREVCERLEQLQQPAEPCEPRANPRVWSGNTPNQEEPFPIDNGITSLTESLGAVADDLRGIYTDLGQRPYRVFSVVYRWTGGEDGSGTPEVLSEAELLPRPRVSLRPLSKELSNAGIREQGFVRIDQISPRYTEADVQALFGRRRNRGEFAFIEVQADNRDGSSVRRRMTVSGVPFRDASSFEWSVDAYVQEDYRTPDGQFRERTAFPLRPEGP